MKILITISMMIMTAIVRMPVETLPSQKVMGSYNADYEIRKTEDIKSSATAKRIYLQTGKHINSQINKQKMDNYWSLGMATKVRFPSHLAEWEEFRRSNTANMLATS